MKYVATYECHRCDHQHTHTGAVACAEKWHQRMLEYNREKALTVPVSREMFRVVRWVPKNKAPIWCYTCKKNIPRIRWHGHYERNHGTNSPGRRPHKTHRMTKWRSEIRCPASTPRFYGVRECKRCGLEELSHPAGHFNDGLREPCGG